MTLAKAQTWAVQSVVQRTDHYATMASLLTVEAVLRSLIIIRHSCKRTSLFTSAFTKLYLKPAVYLLISVIISARHSYKLSWGLFVEGPGMFSHLESRSENSNLMITVGAVLFTYP